MQPGFNFTAAPAPIDPSPLLSALKGRGWVRREVIARELGMTVRAVRELAEHSDGQVIGGNKGLALVWDVSVTEAERAARRLIRQGEKMIARGRATQHQMHRLQPAA